MNLTVLTDDSELGRACKRQKNKLIYLYIKFWDGVLQSDKSLSVICKNCKIVAILTFVTALILQFLQITEMGASGQKYYI